MKYGLLGGRLGHSLSPRIHELFFARTGKKGTYELLETELEDLPARMEKMRSAFAGANVTIPHKLHVMPLLDKIAPEAAAIGAVNTIKFENGKAYGYNTDYFGFARLLAYNGIDVAGRTVAVLGTGGAARAVVKYLADADAGQLYIVTRDVAKADRHFLAMAPQARFIGYDALRHLAGDLIINCTPVGMYPKVDAAPVGADVCQAFSAAVDLIYNPAETLFLHYAHAAGHKGVNGLFMLVAQAVASEEIWQGESYSSELIAAIAEELERGL